MAESRSIGNWQSELDAFLTASRSGDLLNSFRSVESDADRIKLIFDEKLLSRVDWLLDYFLVLREKLGCKNSALAAQHKQEGNKLFLAGLDRHALLSYTKSIQYSCCRRASTDQGTDIGLAYGNRSAALFRLHMYQECLTDIERALAAGFSSLTQHKLLVRCCLCHARLGHIDMALKAQQNLAMAMSTCDKILADHLEGEMTKIAAEIQAVKEREPIKQPASDPQTFPKPIVSCGVNSVLTQASSAVEMRRSRSRGRYLQAKSRIKAGDTLIMERPFAGVLLPPHYATHCAHCFAALPDNPVSCQECSHILYCNECCRDQSWSTYHQWECRYLDLLHSVGIAHLSIRIVLTAGFPFLLDFLLQREKLMGKEVTLGMTEDGRYEWNYVSVYDLMTHSTDMVTEDLFQYSLTASVLLAILIHSGWFSSSRSASKGNLDNRNSCLKAFLYGELNQAHLAALQVNASITQVFAVGGTLLRHVQQLVCNAHAITALQVTRLAEEHLVETQSQVRIATAIYPTASLMNHSCDPTIISSFQKDLLIVKSVKDVPIGGEIFNCYGPHCKRMKREDRQRQLKTQYFFDCHCYACAVAKDDHTIMSQGLLCPDCAQTLPTIKPHLDLLVCPSCHVTVDIATIMYQLKAADDDFCEGMKYLEEGDHRKALRKVESCLKLRSKSMSLTNHDLGQAYDAAAQCLAMEGRYSEAADHLTHSLRVTEAIFGAGSIETARELHKMAEVLVHAGRTQEALSSTSRALDLANDFCISSDEWVQELLCLKTALTRIIADGRLQ